MTETKSFSDYVREYIVTTHQANPKYFEEKTVRERNQDFKLFCDANSAKGLNYDKHRGLLNQQLAKLSKSLHIDLSKAGINTPQEKYQVTKGNLPANITIAPTQQKPQDATQPAQTAPQTGAQQQTQQTQQTAVLHPALCQCMDCKAKRNELPQIEADEAGAILEIIIDFWHSRNPKVQPMTEQEVLTVGKRLKPILQKHLGGDVLLYGLALLAVGRVFTSRFDQARGNKKDDIEKKRDEANNKTSEKKKNERTYTDEPAPDSETTKIRRKFYNNEKVKKIMDDAEKDEDE